MQFWKKLRTGLKNSFAWMLPTSPVGFVRAEPQSRKVTWSLSTLSQKLIYFYRLAVLTARTTLLGTRMTRKTQKHAELQRSSALSVSSAFRFCRKGCAVNNLLKNFRFNVLSHLVTRSPVHSISWSLGLFVFLIPAKLAPACPLQPTGYRGYSFINPRVIDSRIPSAPLFIDIKALYETFGGQAVVQEVDNVAEWRLRYCERATEADIQFVVYDTELRDLEQLRTEIAFEQPSLSYPFTDNTFARYLKRHDCIETVDYLLFAKQCEPHATLGDDPWETPERNLAAMQTLINTGLAAFKNTKSHYIRLRYAYQIIRLAHYRQDYAGVLSLYDFLMPQIDNDPSIIEYWIEGHRAGALSSLGCDVEASYIFSKIFENCPSKAESAFRSFSIKTDTAWTQCLKLCQSDRERATLYVLRAQSADSRALPEMERIYKLDPNNPHLDILLTNEIYKLEKDLLGLDFNDQRAHNRRLGYPRPNAGRYAVGLHDFMVRVLKEKKITQRAYWQVALGYLDTLMGNFYDAEQSFARAQRLVNNPLLKEQLQVFQLAMQISAFRSPTEEVETAADNIRDNTLYRKYRDFPDFLKDKMAQLYGQGESPGKAFLTRYRFRDLKVNPQLVVIDDLLKICRKTRRSSLETALIAKSGGGTIEKDLIDLKGTLLFSEYRLEEALNVYKEMDRNEWINYGLFNPFVERFKDCVLCQPTDTSNTFTKGDLIERFLSLESLARTDAKNSAEYYFDLGVAYYNMSYFSYNWKVWDYFRGDLSVQPAKLRDGEAVVPHPNFPRGNREHFDCSRALYYFDRARQLATNPELAAKAAYWAAKCERNTWYVQRVQGARHAYEYFGILKNDYADTDYYKRVVRECKTFRAYLAR